MRFRPLGNTGLNLSWISYGAASLGQEYRAIRLNEALDSVRVALDLGMNFIDTSPYYGRGVSECLLGFALAGIPRDRYYLGTKLGRYDVGHFDFSARRVRESIDVSLQRMKVDHLDIILCHDIEFVDMRQIVDETLPELERIKQSGKVRFVGVSGYPMHIFQYILERHPLDVVLSYNHYTLQNTMFADLVPFLKAKGVGIMNASPFSARLLTNTPLPPWHKAPSHVRQICRQAAEFAAAQGVDIAQLALQFSLAHEAMTTCVVGSASPDNIRSLVKWSEEPLDTQLITQVREILKPIDNWYYIEGRPENNDPVVA